MQLPKAMQLIALMSDKPQLIRALQKTAQHPELAGVHFQAVNQSSSLEQVTRALKPLNFAGALILEESAQPAAFSEAHRASLVAQDVGAADALTVTAAGLIADYHFGRAVTGALRRRGWEARGASAIILGSGTKARAISRELSSLGVGVLAVLTASQPLAEDTVRGLAASTQVIARAHSDGLTHGLLERADLVLRLGQQELPTDILGPHLTLVDLSGDAMSPLRRLALQSGALTLSLKDVQAEQLALSLSFLLDTKLTAEPFFTLFEND